VSDIEGQKEKCGGRLAARLKVLGRVLLTCRGEDARHLLAWVVARMHTLVVVDRASKLNGALCRSARADGQDKVGILVADHGPWVVWSVVSSGAGRGSSWAVNRLASWVGRVVGHGWVDDDAALREWVALGSVGVAIDVGQIPEDAVARPGVLELRDRSGQGVAGRELDGDTDALFAVLGGISTGAKQLHGFSSAIDGGIVNVEVAVVVN